MEFPKGETLLTQDCRFDNLNFVIFNTLSYIISCQVSQMNYTKNFSMKGFMYAIYLIITGILVGASCDELNTKFEEKEILRKLGKSFK